MESKDAVLIRILTSFWEDLRDFERFRIVVGILEILRGFLGGLVSDYRKRFPKKGYKMVTNCNKLHQRLLQSFRDSCDYFSHDYPETYDYQASDFPQSLRLSATTIATIPPGGYDYSATIPRLFPATIRQPFTTILQTICDYFRQELRLSHDYSGQALRLSRKLGARGKPPGAIAAPDLLTA